MGAKNTSQYPDLSASQIGIVGKSNHFWAEDLKGISELDEEELLETSLSSWVSSKEMEIEQAVYDDGSTEIFFPFEYDKHQLRVLGLTKNRAIVVKGPPGTGKSQTISNLLVHLAATGHRVLFASQKDQAVRGVKDTLKSLDIPFLFGYIPDKTSKLYTKEDEEDSASNALKSISRDFLKYNMGDIKKPLSILHEKKSLFNESINNNRKFYQLYEQKEELSYVEPLYRYNIRADWYENLASLEEKIYTIQKKANNYEKVNSEFIEEYDEKTHYLNLNYNFTAKNIGAILVYLEENLPERSTLKFFEDFKLINFLKSNSKNLVQEIYVDVKEIITSSDSTKSMKIRDLQALIDYFAYKNNLEELNLYNKELDRLLSDKAVPPESLPGIRQLISTSGPEKIFRDLEKYEQIQDEINRLEIASPNEINRELKDIKKFYKTNIAHYVRNRILQRVDEVNRSKDIRATLNRVARSLSKSKKANKTFDKLKHDSENFTAMSQVMPVWMMSLDDVSRIVPLEKNCFDYVIIDEASQCNFAYAIPAMFRAKHTILFGDTL